MNETIAAMWEDIDRLVTMRYVRDFKVYLTITRTTSTQNQKSFAIHYPVHREQSSKLGEMHCRLFPTKIEVLFEVEGTRKIIIVEDNDEEKYLDEVIFYLNDLNERARVLLG
ncbi:hypothetical protein ACNA6I_14720 [Rossellomorea sp. FS2]|uniref:hypothetical protein n=1 Tax=Rossellomorea sp. FS2 TaxID=3391447 RepID=UPI003A4DF08F